MLKIYPLDIECYRYFELGFNAKEKAIDICKEIIYKGYNEEDIPKEYKYDIVRELTSGFGDFFDKEGNLIYLTYHETEDGFVEYVTYQNENGDNIKVMILNEKSIDSEGNILGIGDKVQVINNNKVFIIKDFEKDGSVRIGKNGLRNYKFTNCKSKDLLKIL